MRIGTTAAILAVLALTATTGCSADDAPAPSPEPTISQAGEPNPQEPVSELVEESDLIVAGFVESVHDVVVLSEQRDYPAQQVVVRVTETLKGESDERITVSKPEGTWYYLTAVDPIAEDSKHEGVFALRETGDGYTLFGNSSMRDDAAAQPAFTRVLAGLPEHGPVATPEQIEEWTERADVIVFAAAQGYEDDIVRRAPRSVFAGSALLTPIEVLKGSLPEPTSVVRGPQPDRPGGSWTFPLTGMRGVFFLDMSGETPVVLNTTDPSQINRRLLPL